MIEAMFTVLVAWLILFCLIAGLGQFVRTLFGLRSESLQAWFAAFWIGYAVVIGALQLWHFVLPIDWRTCLVLGVIGLVGFGLGIKNSSRRPFSKLRIVLLVILLAPVVLWVANRALDAQLDFDTGLYHIASIRWANDYPAVLGLGNLHYRLAFNQSFFLFVAALNLYPFFNQGFHLASSLLVIVLIAQLIENALYSLYCPAEFSPDRLLSVLFLPVILYRVSQQPYSANISSPSPDLPVFVLMAVVSLEFARFLCAWEVNRNREGKFSLFYIMALSAVGVTTKLSFLPFGAAAVALGLLVWIARQRSTIGIKSALRQSIMLVLIAGTLTGLPWIAHGIISSGYPLFPSTLGALPVDWKIPTSITVEARDWIYSFAREPHVDSDVVFSSWQWVTPWFARMQSGFEYFLFTLPFYVFVAAVIAYTVLLFILARMMRKGQRIDWRLWLPLISAAISGITWFFSAPDPRFAGATFWILGLWSLVMLCTLIQNTLAARPPSRLAVYPALALPVIVAALLVTLGLGTQFKMQGSGFPHLPFAPMKPYQTRSGLVVNIPANDNNPLQLWDAPLPATPYELPNLELRGTDLRDGFSMGQGVDETPSN